MKQRPIDAWTGDDGPCWSREPASGEARRRSDRADDQVTTAEDPEQVLIRSRRWKALLSSRCLSWLRCGDVTCSSEGLQVVRRGRVLDQVGWDDVVGLHLLSTDWFAPQWTADGPAGRGSSGLPTVWVCRPGQPANPYAGQPFARVLLTTRAEVVQARASLMALGAARGIHVSDAKQAMENDASHLMTPGGPAAR